MSLYRNIVWFIKGMQEYTRGRYETASKSFVTKDLDVSVVGRSFMITGANSGIGKEAAMAIAKKGGTVHLVCRNKERAEAAREEIIRESGNTMIYVHLLDLSETRKVWEFAEAFKREHPTLNVLINNAGCMVNQRELTSDGLEKNFATNTLGVYVLTKCLIPLLEKSRDPRVITVSSGGMLVQQLNSADLQTERTAFDGTMVYAQNKRQQVVMTEVWAKAHPKIHFSVMHPGWADTAAVATAMPQFYQMMRDRLRTAEQGADTVVWLAVSSAAKATASGLFFQDRRVVPTHLPLAWTSSSQEEIQVFRGQLETLAMATRPTGYPANA
ncbi:dehydrogenase/reductase SDR family member 12 [Astyanax mexicanus]|uniref:Dehydrogenase/reductase SDR family member 12-like n=2 Tax=Astyanax mexicanus TaxID=7994 RepID=A0A8T2M0Z3_ASTMX|nr:dehydrogenase/reductase SDR family member 12 [Astyanax mexicanus]KAG9278278.1 dehydrogenase/reductase SDR family member 12-like [Astyanax mexicanus]